MSILKFDNFSIKENSLSTNGLELHYWAFDWDDNILHMPTTILMDRKEDGDWSPVEVSTSEFAIVRNDKENYRLRNNNPIEAFSQFRDTGPRGQNAFLEDVKKALSIQEFGPSWGKFITCLTDGAIFSIITARGHEPETIKLAVEYIIDNFLSDDEKYLMYNNCLKHSYFFDKDTDFDRIAKGPLSKTKLITAYLSHCDFYGVSSESFKQEFGEASAQNPEHAKEMALHKFIDKCNEYGKRIGAKSVSVGFSDDDPKNVEHVRVMFKEKSALSHDFEHELKLSLHKTTDRKIKGGEITKFRKGEEIPVEEANDSIQAPGMASSVMSFTQYNNMASRLFPGNNKDNDPVANSHRLATDYITKQTKEWTKDLKKKSHEGKKIKK
jgi:hypothetical protein